jgi:molecular chaperone GrpE
MTDNGVSDAGAGGAPASPSPSGSAEGDGDAAAPPTFDDGPRGPGAEGPDGVHSPVAGEVLDGIVTDEGAEETLIEDDPLAAVTAQRDEYLALAQRTQADFENFRKRMARETRVAESRGVSKVVKELLPALDNLDRALRSAAQDDPLLHGIRLVQSDLAGALTRLGIEAFSPTGERFDPSVHEAMAQTQVEGASAGTIVEVYSPGYRAGETVLRPARVVVAA